MRKKTLHADRRFHAPRLGGPGDTVVLAPDEAHHLARVLRLRQGDRVSVFDGAGREFLAEVASAARSNAAVTLIEPIEPAAEPRVPFSIVQGVLKGSAMDEVVRDATMIGAASIEPLVTAHVAVKGSLITRAETADRWRRIALASTRQCRRAVLPIVREPSGLSDWLASSLHGMKLILVEPAADASAVSFRTLMARPAPASAALIVGPEGGWATREIAAAVAAGCQPVTLGGLTLRADAVALAAGCLFRFLWES
jgi:16S rRNA (uracil1498-N3)-methyltransferase